MLFISLPRAALGSELNYILNAWYLVLPSSNHLFDDF